MAHVADPAWKRGACETYSSAKGEFSSLFLPSDGVRSYFHGIVKPARIDDEFGRMRLSGMNTVLHPDLGRVHMDPLTDHVQLSFNRKSSLGNAMPSHGPSHGFVRIHVVPFIHEIGHMIGYHEKIT